MTSIKIAILEDNAEELAHLQSLLSQSEQADFEIVKLMGSIKEAIAYFATQPAIDLAFLDIQLPDGESFELFQLVEMNVPFIFTSSYDHYVLQAIKVNGVDYLIKPIDMNEFEATLKNYFRIKGKSKKYELDEIKSIVSAFAPRSYKSSFLVNFKQKMLLIDVSEVAYFHVKEKLTFMVTHSCQEYLVDYFLDQLEEELDPARFYRVNRQYLMSRACIKEIENYFNGRMLINVVPPVSEPVIISRKKVSDFKSWADS